jgi:hypothetical protein
MDRVFQIRFDVVFTSIVRAPHPEPALLFAKLLPLINDLLSLRCFNA